MLQKKASVGRIAAIRRQTKSEKNGLVLRLLTNDTSLTKICEIAGLSPCGVYSKIDFIHRQVRACTARRKSLLEGVDWDEVGTLSARSRSSPRPT
jgi:hypothetical protein